MGEAIWATNDRHDLWSVSPLFKVGATRPNLPDKKSDRFPGWCDDMPPKVWYSGQRKLKRHKPFVVDLPEFSRHLQLDDRLREKQTNKQIILGRYFINTCLIQFAVWVWPIITFIPKFSSLKWTNGLSHLLVLRGQMQSTLRFISRMMVRLRVQITPRTHVGQPSHLPSGEDKLVAALILGAAKASSDGQEPRASVTKLFFFKNEMAGVKPVTPLRPL